MECEIYVDNIKCGGCASQITKQLNAIDGVQEAIVSVEEGKVNLKAEESALPQVRAKLEKMGYPETGTQKGLEAMGSKAKSYVSCAIGKMNAEETDK